MRIKIIGMKKILIVEDQLILATLYERYLAMAGFEVAGFATSCDETLEIIERDVPDVILMDIQINGDKDGIETVKIIKSKWTIPYIFITGNSDDATKSKAMETNPNGFMSKPVGKDDLINAINKIVSAA